MSRLDEAVRNAIPTIRRWRHSIPQSQDSLAARQLVANCDLEILHALLAELTALYRSGVFNRAGGGQSPIQRIDFYADESLSIHLWLHWDGTTAEYKRGVDENGVATVISVVDNSAVVLEGIAAAMDRLVQTGKIHGTTDLTEQIDRLKRLAATIRQEREAVGGQ